MLVQTGQVRKQVVAYIALVLAVVTVEGEFCRLVVDGGFPFKKLVRDQTVGVALLNLLVQGVSVQGCVWATSAFEVMCDATCSIVACTAKRAFDSALLEVEDGTSVVEVNDLVVSTVSARVHMLARLAT